MKVGPAPSACLMLGRRAAYFGSPTGASTLIASIPPSKKIETRTFSGVAAWAMPRSKAESGIFEAP